MFPGSKVDLDARAIARPRVRLELGALAWGPGMRVRWARISHFGPEETSALNRGKNNQNKTQNEETWRNNPWNRNGAHIVRRSFICN